MKILMHMCCAPCAIYPVSSLKLKGYTITGLYYNPNIHPFEEFVKREENIEKLAAMESFDVLYLPDYAEDLWLALKDKDDKKCKMCYGMRMNETFKIAKENNFDAVTTSLLVSPYQNHEMLVQTCNHYSKKYDIPFYYEDFRVGYREGQQKAKGFGLYCQRYCGCVLSLKETIKEIGKEFQKEKQLKEQV